MMQAKFFPSSELVVTLTFHSSLYFFFWWWQFYFNGMSNLWRNTCVPCEIIYFTSDGSGTRSKDPWDLIFGVGKFNIFYFWLPEPPHIIMPKILPNMSKRHVQLATHTLICLIRHYYQALLTILILIGCNLFGAIFKNYSLITRERKHLVILKNDVTNHSEIRIKKLPAHIKDFLLLTGGNTKVKKNVKCFWILLHMILRSYHMLKILFVCSIFLFLKLCAA